MNLDYLRTFLEVTRQGSFSAVARKLGISQPAVSFQIHKLESELGLRLLDRAQKPLGVTEAGRRLIKFAETVDEKQAALKGELDTLREDIAGQLVIGASTIPGEYLLPPILAGFREMHPAVKVRVNVADSGAVIEAVRRGETELGFTGFQTGERDLTFFPFASDEIVLVVYTGHPFADRRQVSIGDLEGEPLVFREAQSGTQESLKTRLAAAGYDIRYWEAAMVMGSTQAVVAAVAAGAGIAFVSNLATTRQLEAGTVRQVAVDGLKLRRDFYAVHRQDGLATRLYQEFAAFVVAKGERP